MCRLVRNGQFHSVGNSTGVVIPRLRRLNVKKILAVINATYAVAKSAVSAVSAYLKLAWCRPGVPFPIRCYSANIYFCHKFLLI